MALSAVDRSVIIVSASVRYLVRAFKIDSFVLNGSAIYP